MALNQAQIAGLNDLNKRIASGYQATQTDLANLDYAKKQGYTYNPLPAGATKINDPSGLQGLTESQLYRQGADIYKLPKIPTNVSINDTTGNTGVPAGDIQSNLMDTSVAGNLAYQNSLNDQLAKQEADIKAQEANLASTRSNIQKYTEQLGLKGQDYQTELAKYNYQPNVTQLQEINKQIASANAAFEKASVDNQGRPVLNAMIGGQESLIRRQQASEIGALTSMAQALQGNITLAEQTAKNAIDIKYEGIQNQIDLEKNQLENIYNDLSRADKAKADTRLEILNERQRLLEEQKTKDTDINNILLKAAQGGADTNTLNKIRQSKTVGEAIANSDGFLRELKDKNIQVIGKDNNDNNIYGYWDNASQSFVDIYGNKVKNTTASTTVAAETTDLPNEVISGTPTWARVLIQSKAEETGIPASLISAVIKQESGFNPNASNVNSKETSYGLGQINLKAHPEITKEQATDPGFAINFVANRLKTMIDKYGLYDGVQAYNTPGAIGSQQLINYADNILGMAGIKQAESISRTDKIALDIFNGVGTLSKVSTKDYPAVQNKLSELKSQALAEGNIEGIMKASAGGKDVDATTVTSFEKAFNVIGQLGDLQKSITNEATGPIMGIIRSNNPYDAKASLIQAQLTALVPNLARGIYGEVGVLTDNDVKLYSQTLPNLKSTEEVRDLILAATVRSVQRSIENKIKVQAGLGRDVSGLINSYGEIKGVADKLSGGQTGETQTNEANWLSQSGYINTSNQNFGTEQPKTSVWNWFRGLFGQEPQQSLADKTKSLVK